MSINSVNSLLGMSYPYMNPYLSSYGYINSLYGAGYGNLLQTTSIDNAESFTKVLEKINERGIAQKENKPIEQKAESKREGNIETTIPMAMVSRSIPRINVVTGIEHMELKKVNPYVTVYQRR